MKPTFISALKYIIVVLLCVLIGIAKVKSYVGSQDYYEFEGSIYFTKVTVASYTGGNIDELPVSEGAVIKSGELIAQISNDLLDSRIRGLEQDKADGANYDKADYYELLKRKEGLTIVSPYDAVVLKLYGTKFSKIKDFETIAEIAPIDSIKYSAVFTDFIIKNSTVEMQNMLKVGQKVKVQVGNSVNLQDGVIEKIVPFVDTDATKEIKQRVLISAPQDGSVMAGFGREIKIRFVKENLINKTLKKLETVSKFVTRK